MKTTGKNALKGMTWSECLANVETLQQKLNMTATRITQVGWPPPSPKMLDTIALLLQEAADKLDQYESNAIRRKASNESKVATLCAWRGFDGIACERDAGDSIHEDTFENRLVYHRFIPLSSPATKDT